MVVLTRKERKRKISSDKRNKRKII